MKNLLRALIYENAVSLTVADTTEIVREGIRLHGLSPASAYVFGKALSALAYMSGCLKEEVGEISLSLQRSGGGESMGASGNRALRLRGYMDAPQIAGSVENAERLALGQAGSLTVVRDDGYNRPFVGSCAFPEQGGLDEIVEEYYRISEQLPTRIRTTVEFDGEGACTFAGVIALQPLPFASKTCLEGVEGLPLEELLFRVKREGVEEVARSLGAKEPFTIREAVYRCNCSRDYLARVLVTLGEAQLREIIRTEGAVRVHCHYCNSDYEFTSEDADELFPKKA